jgi:hypothetical protein
MKKSPITTLLAALLFSAGPLLAADQAATVTEAYNQVNHGPSQSTQSYPAKAGTQIHDGEYVKTGAASRAELQLSNQTITRLGANTIFNYSLATNEIDLQAGTILFSKPKDGKQLNIKTAAVTAAIVGTTGFGKAPGLFGLVEGKAKIVVDGKTYTLHAGQILLVGPPPQIINFDVPLFLQTSHLITGFKGPLPNQKYIDEEIADYNDDVDRGFIRHPKPPFFTFNDQDGFPTIPFIGADSKGTALGVENTPPPQQSYYWYSYGFKSAN